GAQGLGELRGVVTDESGGVLEGARVTVILIDGVYRQVVSTKSDGTFALTSLPLGRYRVEAESRLFETGQTELTLSDANTRGEVKIILRVRAFGENVTVTAATRTERD